jgi:hypothetical protein
MKKSKKKAKPAKAKPQPNIQPQSKSKRAFLSSAGPLLGGAVLLSGVGFWGVRTVQASVAERDLTKVGLGTPTVVQIHDPQCVSCAELQRETRAALKHFDSTELGYLVADLNTQDGLAFASRYGAEHVTLLLFDGAGRPRQRIVGVTDRDTLQQAFAAHLNAD